MSYLLSLYSDEKFSGAVVWHCLKAFKLGDQVWDMPEGTEDFSVAINKAKRINVIEAIRDVSGTGIQGAIDEYDFRCIIANQTGESKHQLYGLATYRKPLPSVADSVSAFTLMKQDKKLRLGSGTATLQERFTQGHYDHPAVKAFSLGLVYAPKYAFPVYGYGRIKW